MCVCIFLLCWMTAAAANVNSSGGGGNSPFEANDSAGRHINIYSCRLAENIPLLPRRNVNRDDALYHMQRRLAGNRRITNITTRAGERTNEHSRVFACPECACRDTGKRSCSSSSSRLGMYLRHSIMLPLSGSAAAASMIRMLLRGSIPPFACLGSDGGAGAVQ